MFPNTVVVPLDGSDLATRALAVARAFARQTRGRLLLVSTRWDHDLGSARSYLEGIASTCTGLDVETVVIADRPAAEAILLVASETTDRIVCMTSHGRGRVRWALLGSVAEQIVRESAAPVILLGRHCRTEWPNNFRRVLLCVDGATTSPTVLPAALEWATHLGLEVHVASAVHPLDTEPPDAVLDAIVEQFDARRLSAYKSIVRSSFAAGALADLGDSLDVDLIAMSSHARTGAGRVALGSVTMGVVSMAHCPVLVTCTV